MTIALLFGEKSQGMRNKMLTIRDDNEIDVYTSVSDLISGSKTRNKVYQRIIILSSVLTRGVNTAKELQTLYNYWRSFCDSSEFVMVGRKGGDEKLAEQFHNIMCSPLCTAMLIQNSSAVVLADMITKSVKELSKNYGLALDMDIEIETDTYDEPVVEQPKPAVQQPVTQAKPKKKGLFGKLFGKKDTPEAQTQEPPVQENEVQENIAETENFEQPTEYAENDGSYYDEQADMENENYSENLNEEGYPNADLPVDYVEEDYSYDEQQSDFSEVGMETASLDNDELADENLATNPPQMTENDFNIGNENDDFGAENDGFDGESSFGDGYFDEEPVSEDYNSTSTPEEDFADDDFDDEDAFAGEADDFSFIPNAPAPSNEGVVSTPDENAYSDEDFEFDDNVDYDVPDDFFTPVSEPVEEPVSTQIEEPMPEQSTTSLDENAYSDEDFEFGVSDAPADDSDEFDDIGDEAFVEDSVDNDDISQNTQTEEGVADMEQGGSSNSTPQEPVANANEVPDFSFEELGIETTDEAEPISFEEMKVETVEPEVPVEQAPVQAQVQPEPVASAPAPAPVSPAPAPEPAAPTKKKGLFGKFGKSEANSRATSPLHQKFGHKKAEEIPPEPQYEEAPEPVDEGVSVQEVLPVHEEIKTNASVSVPEFNTATPTAQSVKAQSVGSDEVADDDDLFGDVDVAGLDSAYSAAEQASNVRVERVEVVREVIKEMPTSGGSKKVLKNLLSGNGHRVLLVTGDRGVGVTTFAYELAQELAKHVGVLYYDGDTERHGLLNYIDIERYYQYDVSQQQGAKLAKTTRAFNNCVMRYDNNIDLISTGLGVSVTDDEYEAVQSVIADISNDYNVIVAEIPFDKLHLCQELLQIATVFVLAEQTKRGLINLGCCFDKSELSTRHKRRITSNGTLLLTKGDKKVDVKKLKKCISDIIDFEEEECNWLGMRTFVREKITEKYLQQIID